MIALAFVLVVLRSAIALNSRASNRLEALEAACSNVEADAGNVITDAASVILTVSFSDEAKTIQIPLVQKSSGQPGADATDDALLQYFTVKEEATTP